VVDGIKGDRSVAPDAGRPSARISRRQSPPVPRPPRPQR
jgi:hypothetical protein